MCHEMPLKLFCLLVAVVSLIENGFNFYLVEFTTKRAREAKPCYYYDSESFRYLVHNEYFNFVTRNNRNQTAVTNNDFFFLPSTIAPRGWQDFAIIINIIFTVFNIALLISSPLTFPHKKMVLIAWEFIYFLFFCFKIAVLFACVIYPLKCKGCVHLNTELDQVRMIVWNISIAIDAIFHIIKWLGFSCIVLACCVELHEEEKQ
ncbi:uncharacterized protein ACN2A1_000766 [Glossina fuscipes fuscipes]